MPAIAALRWDRLWGTILRNCARRDPCPTGPTAGLVAELDSPLRVSDDRTVCRGGCCASWTRACDATFADVLAHVREIRDTCRQRSGTRTTTAWAPCALVTPVEEADRRFAVQDDAAQDEWR